jgi:hypothetical protein
MSSTTMGSGTLGTSGADPLRIAALYFGTQQHCMRVTSDDGNAAAALLECSRGEDGTTRGILQPNWRDHSPISPSAWYNCATVSPITELSRSSQADALSTTVQCLAGVMTWS